LATEVVLPKLGMNTESATIVRWHKREGDVVSVGDVLADVETDKATIELEADAGGVLRKLLAGEGERIALYQAVAVLGSADEDISALLERAAAPPPAERHVERVYHEWRASGQTAAPAPNGNGTATTAPACPPVRPLTVSAVAAAPRRLDPSAIRARLIERGALPNPGGVAAVKAKTRLVIYGAGLGAKQLLEITRHLEDVQVIGIVDDNPSLEGVSLSGVPVLGGYNSLAELKRRGEVDGVALSFHSEVRRKVHRRLASELGVKFISLVDPRAHVGIDVKIGDGALIEAGAVVGPGTEIGEGTIVDVGAIVAHDCFLGRFSHLSPGCALSGVVSLTENVLVGVGAAINSTVTIGRNVIITPGAAVMNDLPDDVIVGGVPAKVLGKSRRGG
jgi:sugar O-acyltransferase (sialic acid O-acetyltransferase NeuD family)